MFFYRYNGFNVFINFNYITFGKKLLSRFLLFCLDIQLRKDHYFYTTAVVFFNR
ncbi:hypothetical protein LEP1GSC194_1241 [Leptospira alstonii serovar Sichuan str. 79601]|uniref:Uncharacterized protein n=1 Tax=Leptospira alstonii serovar Sichuan str. 79601 TaxID=1218565 RepID=M6CJV9_9LEPT|nr:hypothetical protein LEP1GSC194_1241 [Leptospira alstonii serovar Sichuan str. 79601]